MSNNVRHSLATTSSWFLLHLFLLLLAFSAAWGITASNGFFYSYWYDYYNLEKTIDHYSVLNDYKKGFEKTNKRERVRLFDGIVTAIHKGGEGLDSLAYYDPQGKKLGYLLREPEVVHLMDVSILIDRLKRLSMIILVLTLLLFIVLKRFKLSHPPPLKLFIPFALVLVVSVLMVTLIGPQQFFYWLHIQIFPADHQWFFYYQESLMSTMMKAPVIFGGIAMVITGMGLFIQLFFEILLFRGCLRK